MKLRYDTGTAALRRRFEPESRELYFTEFQTRGRVSNETWAELARLLIVSKVFPDLSDDARQQLALDCFLSQPESSLGVRP